MISGADKPLIGPVVLTSLWYYFLSEGGRAQKIWWEGADFWKIGMRGYPSKLISFDPLCILVIIVNFIDFVIFSSFFSFFKVFCFKFLFWGSGPLRTPLFSTVTQDMLSIFSQLPNSPNPESIFRNPKPKGIERICICWGADYCLKTPWGDYFDL